MVAFRRMDNSTFNRCLSPKILSDALKEMPEPVYIRDAKKRILYMNKACEELVGKTTASVFKKNCYDIFGSACDWCQNHKCPFEVNNSCNTFTILAAIINSQKKDQKVVIRAAPIKKPKDKLVGFVVLIYDYDKLFRISDVKIKTMLFRQDKELLKKWKSLVSKLVKEKFRCAAIKNELEKHKKQLKVADDGIQMLIDSRQRAVDTVGYNILANIRDTVLPYVECLKNANLNRQQQECLNIVFNNLENIVSPLAKELSLHFKLSPMEVKVANLIKNGKSTKEIAFILNLSPHTITTHRQNIRIKMGLKERKARLHDHLKNME